MSELVPMLNITSGFGLSTFCLCVQKICVCMQWLYHDIIDLCSRVLMCDLPKFAATVISLLSWPSSWPSSSLARHQTLLSHCLKHTCNNIHPHTQSEIGPKDQCETKDSAGGASPNQGHAPGGERHCHLCPTWMHSHINAARRKAIWPPVWLEIQQGQLVHTGNTTHSLLREWRWGESLQCLHFGCRTGFIRWWYILEN